jgi:hypothetical protein
MQDSSFGTKNRIAEFTINYNKGIVNTHEEVFKLAYNWGVITREGNNYIMDGEKFKGKPLALQVLSQRPDLQVKLVKGLRALEGTPSAKEMSEAEAEKAFENAGKEIEE